MTRVTWSAAALVGYLLASCSVLTPVSPEELVAARAQERLDLMWSGEMKQSYEYTTPGYRSARTWQQYSRNWQGVGMWVSASVVKVECSEFAPRERCEATVRVAYQAPKVTPGVTHLKETWLYVEGDWYLYQQI